MSGTGTIPRIYSALSLLTSRLLFLHGLTAISAGRSLPGRLCRFSFRKSAGRQVALPLRSSRIEDHAFEAYYYPDFLSKDDFQTVRTECEKLVNQMVPEVNSFAVGRSGVVLGEGSAIRRIMTKNSTSSRIQSITNKAAFPTDVPVEVRTYGVGSGMDWHVDDVLFREPQLEAILTVDQSSDSKTEWRGLYGKVVSIETRPNSLLLVRAGSTLHRVTPLKRGKRTIVKSVYAMSPSEESKVSTEDIFYAHSRDSRNSRSHVRSEAGRSMLSTTVKSLGLLLAAESLLWIMFGGLWNGES